MPRTNYIPTAQNSSYIHMMATGGFGSDQKGGLDSGEFFGQTFGNDLPPTKKLKTGYSCSYNDESTECFTLSPIFTSKDSEYHKVDTGSVPDIGMIDIESFDEKVILYKPSGDRIKAETGQSTFVAYDEWKKAAITQGEDFDGTGNNISYIKITKTEDETDSDLYLKIKRGIYREVPTLRLVDKRISEAKGKSDFGCRTNLCVMVDIIRGLYVGKKSVIADLITDYEILLDNVYWKVHGVSKLTDRLWSELNMVQQEIARRRGIDNEIFAVLRKDAKMTEVHIASEVVRSIARCVEARLVYTYRRHGEGFEKFQLDRAKEQWEGELQCLMDQLENGIGA